jgi:hypothetical protein
VSQGGLCKGIVAGPKGCQKDLSLSDLASGPIDYGDTLSGIIHKDLLPGSVLLSERDIELCNPSAVEFAKLAVPVAFWVRLFVFIPEQLQGNTLPAELMVQIFHGWIISPLPYISPR